MKNSLAVRMFLLMSKSKLYSEILACRYTDTSGCTTVSAMSLGLWGCPEHRQWFTDGEWVLWPGILTRYFNEHHMRTVLQRPQENRAFEAPGSSAKRGASHRPWDPCVWECAFQVALPSGQEPLCNKGQAKTRHFSL